VLQIGGGLPPHLQHLPHGRCGTALLATPFSNKVPGSLHTVVQGGPALSARHHLSATAKYAPPRCYSLRSTFPCIAGWCALVMRAPRIETQTTKEKSTCSVYIKICVYTLRISYHLLYIYSRMRIHLPTTRSTCVTAYASTYIPSVRANR